MLSYRRMKGNERRNYYLLATNYLSDQVGSDVPIRSELLPISD